MNIPYTLQTSTSMVLEIIVNIWIWAKIAFKMQMVYTTNLFWIFHQFETNKTITGKYERHGRRRLIYVSRKVSRIIYSCEEYSKNCIRPFDVERTVLTLSNHSDTIHRSYSLLDFGFVSTNWKLNTVEVVFILLLYEQTKCKV